LSGDSWNKEQGQQENCGHKKSQTKNNIAKKPITKQANILFGFPIELVWRSCPSKEAFMQSIALLNK
jgi:hypothetical protein